MDKERVVTKFPHGQGWTCIANQPQQMIVKKNKTLVGTLIHMQPITRKVSVKNVAAVKHSASISRFKTTIERYGYFLRTESKFYKMG